MRKTCTKCNIEKEYSEFRKDLKTKSGYGSQCKECGRKYMKEHKEYFYEKKKEWSNKNREHIRKYEKEYLSKDENKERKRKKDRKYYNANKEKILSRQKEYYNNNKEICKCSQDNYYKEHKLTILSYKKNWKQNNPKAVREYIRKRRAQKNKVNESYSKEDEQYTINLFNNRCANCGSTERLCIDHHYPLSKGNPLTRQNAVLLCQTCNTSKWIKSPEEFYTEDKLKEISKLLFG